MHLVDYQKSGRSVDEASWVGSSCGANRVVVQGDDASTAQAGDLSRQGALSDLASTLQNDDGRVIECLDSAFLSVSFERKPSYVDARLVAAFADSQLLDRRFAYQGSLICNTFGRRLPSRASEVRIRR